MTTERALTREMSQQQAQEKGREQDRELAREMTRRAAAVCQRADDALLAMGPERRSWTYLPGQRTGAALVDLDRGGAKAVMHLLAAGLSPHAFAQAAMVMAFEDVLDEREAGRRGRHRGDYWIAVYGTPGEPPWGWRLEGHHLSVNWTLAEDGNLRATPLFIGANPARVTDGNVTVLAPLAREEQLAVALLQALDADQRSQAVLPGDVPGDILSGNAASVDSLGNMDKELQTAGVALSDLGGKAADLAGDLVAAYTGRLPAGLPANAGAGARFAWAGGTADGEPRYYRLQAPALLIEFDNTQTGANHVHSVVRRPGGDFGDDVLRSHRADRH